MGRLLRAEKQLENALEAYQSALEIFIQVRSQLGIGSCFTETARVFKDLERFAEASLMSEQALDIDRQIQDRFGEALDLKDQGDALWALEAQMPALAAWWQARALFRTIQDARNAARLDNGFAQIEAAVGAEKWPSVVAELQANAEAIRQNAIEHIRQQLAAQQQPAEDANTGQ
jgi:tetratricopeptide (TPR) repeat protein